MNVYQAIIKRRSIRRFKQRLIPYKRLVKLIKAARLAPSAANFQPWEFIIVDKKQTVDKIFPHTRWAGYLGDKGAPKKGRQPVAYVAVLINRQRTKFPQYAQADLGAAIQNILLMATSHGLGSCWLGAIDKKKIAKILSVPRNANVEYLVALGYPDEKSKIESLIRNHKYYKDKSGQMHVPKRPMKQILRRNRY